MVLSKQKIVFIGSGKVATAISEALKGKREIIQVYSKTLANACKLGQRLGCSFTNDLKKISQEADLYIIAVKDDAIEEVCKKLNLTEEGEQVPFSVKKDKMVVHTSGSTSIEVLKKVSHRCGVLWAMYSFPATKANSTRSGIPPNTPFFIEASDKKTEKELTALVKEMKGTPYYITSEKRAILHLAAVFVNNFSNHLFTIAEALCKEAGVPFSLFLSLAKETVEKLKTQSPALSQTGPAARNDKRILNKHLALLSEGTPLGKTYPAYKKVYEALTKSILDTQRERGQKSIFLK